MEWIWYYRARLYVALGVLWVVPVFNLVDFLLHPINIGIFRMLHLWLFG